MAGLSNNFIDLVYDTSGFDKFADEVARAFLKEAGEAVRIVSKRVERRLESATAAAGLGKLSKGWHSAHHPRGDKISRKPGAIIYISQGRTTDAMLAFAYGARITPRQGKILWIPTEAARRYSRDQGMNPARWTSPFVVMKQMRHRLLRPVVQPNGNILVFYDPDADTEARAARKRGGQKRLKPILLFVGVRYVNLRQRFSIESQLEGASEEIRTEFIRRTLRLQDRVMAS